MDLMDLSDEAPAVRTAGQLTALCPECEQTVMVKTVPGRTPVLMQHPVYGQHFVTKAVCEGTDRRVVSL